MWTAGTARSTAVGPARRDIHGPPWQSAPRRCFVHPAALTLSPSHPSAPPFAAATTPRPISATPPPRSRLHNRLHAASFSRHHSRRIKHSASLWVKQFENHVVYLTPLTSVQVGAPQRDESGVLPSDGWRPVGSGEAACNGVSGGEG